MWELLWNLNDILIIFPNTLAKLMMNYTVILGQRVVIGCKAFGLVRWFLKEKTLRKSTFFDNNRILLIENVNLEDARDIICQSTSIYNAQNGSSLILHVLGRYYASRN